MKRLVKSVNQNYYVFDGFYTREEIPKDYQKKLKEYWGNDAMNPNKPETFSLPEDFEYDKNQKLINKNTSTRDWTNYDELDDYKTKKFYSWNDLTEREKSA